MIDWSTVKDLDSSSNIDCTLTGQKLNEGCLSQYYQAQKQIIFLISISFCRSKLIRSNFISKEYRR